MGDGWKALGVGFLQGGEVGVEFRIADPAGEVELDRFEGPLGRFATSVKDDQEAHDQRGVHLQFDAVFAMRDQMSRPQHALEPAEEELDAPATAIGQRHQVGRQVESIGRQPEFARTAAGLGLNDDQPQGLLRQMVFVMSRSQPRDLQVADDAGVTNASLGTPLSTSNCR